MFALMGIGFIVLYYLSKMAHGQDKPFSSNPVMASGILIIEEETQDDTAPTATERYTKGAG